MLQKRRIILSIGNYLCLSGRESLVGRGLRLEQLIEQE